MFSNVKSGAASPTLTLSRSVGFSSILSLGPSWAYAAELVRTISDTHIRILLTILSLRDWCFLVEQGYPFVDRRFKNIRIVTADGCRLVWHHRKGSECLRTCGSRLFHEAPQPPSFFRYSNGTP